MTTARVLRHNRVHLALHELRVAPTGASVPPLLMLHGLGECTPGTVPSTIEAWPGAVFGLDFTGHGESDTCVGGGYTVEMLVADADAALAELGNVTVVGRGLGGYVGLLLGGVRASMVKGVVIADGPGLIGGGATMTGHCIMPTPPGALNGQRPDPWALLELGRDLRPPDYATLFVRMALDRGSLDEPIAVSAKVRPPWLDAVTAEVGVRVMTVPQALTAFANSA